MNRPTGATSQDFADWSFRSLTPDSRAALWTELVRSEEYFEFMLYPRMAAVAEVAWRMQANSSPANFAARVVPHVARWEALGRTVRSGPWDAFKYMKH